jgi:hypothetical protein
MKLSKQDNKNLQEKVDAFLSNKKIHPQLTVKVDGLEGIILSQKRSNAKNRATQKKPENVEQSLVFSCDIIVNKKQYKYVTFQSQMIRDTYLKSTIAAEVLS